MGEEIDWGMLKSISVPKWFAPVLMLLVFLIIMYGVVNYSMRIGFYEGCQSMSLDMIAQDDGFICGNITKINMEIEANNQGSCLNDIVLQEDMQDKLQDNIGRILNGSIT